MYFHQNLTHPNEVSPAYKMPQHIKDKIIRSKVPPQRGARPRQSHGMKKYNKCSVCPREGKTVQDTATKVKIYTNFSSKNVVYLISCKKCPLHYIGETEKMIRERFAEHCQCKEWILNNWGQFQHKGAHYKITTIENRGRHFWFRVRS